MIIKSLNCLPAVRSVLFAVLILFTATANAKPYAALVIEADSNRVLYERNANALRHPASLTKMMTLYMVFEALDSGKLSLGKRLRVSRHAAAQPATKLGLRPGGYITVKDAILSLVTHSANDAATAIAENLARSEADFARLMTLKARKLGLSRTVFRNASGLPHGKQVTTAWDMARLAKILLERFPHHYHYFSTSRFRFGKRVYRNHNHLLENFPGTDGIKTGYIRVSGFNLVASVKRGTHRLIGVVFGGNSAAKRDAHMRTLLSESFAQLEISASGVKAAKAEPLNIKKLAAQRRKEKAPPPAQKNYTPPARRAKVAAYGTPPLGGESDERYAGTSWRVRLGSFSRMNSAQERITKAKRMAPSLFSGARLSITQHVEDGQQVYIAYLLGLSFDEATSGCRILRRRNLDCLPVYSAG